MNEQKKIEHETQQIIDVIRDFVERSPWRDDYSAKINSLKAQTGEPCVLAVTGRVKAGKSSFLNALLGVDLAKVGITETTATINIFKYGTPKYPEKPVEVVWESGDTTYETLDFMDSLQGNNAETLKRAEGIKELVYVLENQVLKNVTLVDTPGTDAIVGEDGKAHQKVTEQFLNLRKKHQKETEERTASADAIIFLGGHEAGMAAKEFLQDFRNAVNGRTTSINAVGVISKIDSSEKVLEEREMLAGKMAGSLKEELNTVVPISAGLWSELQKLKTKNRLGTMQEKLKTIPEKAFKVMMMGNDFFLQEDIASFYKDTGIQPLSLECRKELTDEMHWSIFRTIAKHLYAYPLEEAVEKLTDIAGMHKIREKLENLFFKRSKEIRCYRIVSELRMILNEIKQKKIRESKELLNEFNRFITGRTTKETEETAQKLSDFVKKNLPVEELEKQLKENVIPPFEELELKLKKQDDIHGALHAILKNRDDFSEEEAEELLKLFGLRDEFDCTLQTAQMRQQYWRAESHQARKNRKKVADDAVMVYGKYIKNNLSNQ